VAAEAAVGAEAAASVVAVDSAAVVVSAAVLAAEVVLEEAARVAAGNTDKRTLSVTIQRKTKIQWLLRL
jgi:hypothetical protein